MRYFHVDRHAFGFLWVDEFGFENTNLHCHALYCGPYLPNSGRHKNALSRLWRQACESTPFQGSFLVSIKRAESFESALAHALKYTAKAPGRDPEWLAELEAAFHQTRRVHSLARFYNAVREDVPGPDAVDAGCPVCGAALLRVGSLGLVSVLEAQGYRDLDVVRRDSARSVAMGARASPVLVPCCWRDERNK
jgi:hypothetical protein